MPLHNRAGDEAKRSSVELRSLVDGFGFGFSLLAHFWRKTLRQDGLGTTTKNSVDLDHPPNRPPYPIRVYSPYVFPIAVLQVPLK